ncbi:restriction endonuclease [Streptomyces sp. LP11]|uniref:Restriction endonuclease n=1 Tax=Streptomyces pyxinicus TaxID=2970331 RepID=A0ABT2B3D9_9ACTN|nr:restriction endonuclease [Streptomyces sp. LP11]MCS0603043.1 restriction endonuclease [Streptomyces sp. LP11]
MTVPLRPVRPVRPVHRDRRFDLRATALFFLLLAIALCVLAFAARTAADVVAHRPLWAVILGLLGLATVVAVRPRWRRFSAARYARRAAVALEQAAERASDSLRDPVAAAPGPSVAPAPVPAEPCEFTVAGTGTATLGADPTTALTAESATVPLGPVDYTALDPDGFERAIADLCERDGCRQVEVVGGAGDLGADVVGRTPDGRLLVVQCKQYCEENKVGSQDMQRFGGTCFTIHEADIAVVVTTSDYTAPALEYAAECGILCVNGQELRAWCEGTGPNPWDLVGLES